jgi:hypothetical protein
VERRIPVILAALCVLLALMCITIGLAFRAANAEALCWRAYVENGEHPPQGDCRRRSPWTF